MQGKSHRENIISAKNTFCLCFLFFAFTECLSTKFRQVESSILDYKPLHSSSQLPVKPLSKRWLHVDQTLAWPVNAPFLKMAKFIAKTWGIQSAKNETIFKTWFGILLEEFLTNKIRSNLFWCTPLALCAPEKILIKLILNYFLDLAEYSIHKQSNLKKTATNFFLQNFKLRDFLKVGKE